MSVVSSPTTADAMANLTGRNQLVLEGLVAAVLADGGLQVDVGRGVLMCGALNDRSYRAGERVRCMATDAGTYLVTGLAIQGGNVRTRVLPVPPREPSSRLSSQSLYEALMRLVIKQNQVLKRGIVLAKFADGALSVTTRKVNPVLARAATNEVFRAGQIVYSIRTDDGKWFVMGSSRD